MSSIWLKSIGLPPTPRPGFVNHRLTLFRSFRPLTARPNNSSHGADAQPALSALADYRSRDAIRL
jgi:hypothetical protein